MPPTYKLTYFPVRALAEPSRLLFAYAGIPYEDNRIDRDKWPEQKASYPWETLPVLEVDGKVLGQSQAILRYLGKQYNLAGENDFESAKCDEMVEAMADFRAAAMKVFMESDETKKAAAAATFLTDIIPKYLEKWNQILTANGTSFLVGKTFSYADFCVANYLQIFNETFKGKVITDKYPALKLHQEAVFNAPGIKEWVEKRPKTDW